MATIAAVNKMQAVSPTVGDRLLIPAAYHEPAPAKQAMAKRSHARRSTGGSQKASVQHRRPTYKGHVKRAAAFHQAPGKLARAAAQ